MNVIVDKFAEGYVWWVTKDGVIHAQGWDNNEEEARRQANYEAAMLSSK